MMRVIFIIACLSSVCSCRDGTNRFLERPIDEQIRKSETIPIGELYRMYLISAESSGSTHLSEPLAKGATKSIRSC